MRRFHNGQGTYARLIKEWPPTDHVNHDKTGEMGSCPSRKGAALDSTVGYSNILFFFLTESTPHRVPIVPERPTVLQVIVALGRAQIDPYIQHPDSQPDPGAGGRAREEAKAKEKIQTTGG